MPLKTMENSVLHIEPAARYILGKISQFFSGEGIKAYLTGGFVRDSLLGRRTADIDIAISGEVAEMAGRMASLFGAKNICLDPQNGVYRVVMATEPWHIDLTRLEGSLETDLSRRDFTIDAMALPLERVETTLAASGLIDPFGGLADLRRRVIKAVGENIFRDDPARLLRAVRLAAELSFQIEAHTEKLVSRDAAKIQDVAGERIREEFLRLLAVPGAGQRLFYMDSLGLLTPLIPELAAARGITQPLLHTWDVFEHSLQTVGSLEFVLWEEAWEYGRAEALAMVPWSEELQRYFDEVISSGSTRRILLKTAALLHDVAKPGTKSVETDGRVRFLGHSAAGADAATIILERMRFSNRESTLVAKLVRHHMRPTQISEGGYPTPRAIYRFFRDTGDAGTGVLFLSLADHLAARGPHLDLAEWERHAKTTAYILARHREMEEVQISRILLNGHEIMKAFNLSPGPKIGTILAAVREAQAAGEISDKAQALAYVERILARESS